ncbi:MAG: pentapeptide repeat-containing protein [Gammaproteobacteria bacterium]|nr:pentapeptide repeat-containing protein [Gammaproteobacteria bacterium]
MSLQEHVTGYLESAGFQIKKESGELVSADRASLAASREKHLVWTPPSLQESGENARNREARLLTDFNLKKSEYPYARCTILVESTQAYSMDFREKMKKAGVNILVPVQFFDAAYRIEESPKTASNMNELQQKTDPSSYIPQPYSREYQEQDGTEEDLRKTLYAAFKQPSKTEPCLHLIVGPAGVGKSELFRSLFSKLYGDFKRDKKRQKKFRRPIPLTPEYLRDKPLRTHDLINEFIKTEVAASVQPETFEWMLVNGYTTWLCDGLDELYTGDRQFFDYILDLMTASHSCAHILICMRDSLLTSSKGVYGLLEDFPPEKDNSIRVYRLCDWNESSKKKLAQRRIRDSALSKIFIERIKPEPLKALSGIPYYCNILLDAFKDKKNKEKLNFSNNLEVLEYAVKHVIEQREVEEKELFSFDNFHGGREEFYEWLGTVALYTYQSDFQAIQSEEVKELAKAILNQDLSKDERDNTITSLIQIALFSHGADRDTVGFKHELIAEYLAAKCMAPKLGREPIKTIASNLSNRVDFANSIMCKYLARHLAENPKIGDKIITALKTESLPDRERGFANLLQILLNSKLPSSKTLLRGAKFMENRNLQGLQIYNIDLTGTSFRNCDLSHAQFQKCTLKESRFERAYLSETKFTDLPLNSLEHATFENLRFESVYIGHTRIKDYTQMINWLEKETGYEEPIEIPCPSAQQLKVLFRKFVHHDGTGRRLDIKENALTKGTIIDGAPGLSRCIETCIDHQYLIRQQFRHRIERSAGSRYRDIVEFVKSYSLMGDMRKLLNDLCPEPECSHVPQ